MRLTNKTVMGAKCKHMECAGFPDFAVAFKRSKYTANFGNWSGVLSRKEFEERCAVGNQELVKKTDAFIDKLETPVINARKKAKVAAVDGPVANVHQAYAGNPMFTRKKVKTVNDTAPVAIFVDVICSAGVDNDTVMRRGAAAMALARLISVTRPVDLYACYGGTADSKNNQIVTVKIPTLPIDLSRAAFALIDPSFMRVGMHAVSADMCGKTSHDGGWFDRNMFRQVASFPMELAKSMGYKESDVVAVGGLALTQVEKFSTDEKTVEWIEENVKEQTK